MKVGFVGMGNLGREAAEVMAEFYDVKGYDIKKIYNERGNWVVIF